jgi:hypothetical protein
MKDFILFQNSYAHSAASCISFTLVTHVISILMVLPNFWNPLLSLIPFLKASLALVLECYEAYILPIHGIGTIPILIKKTFYKYFICNQF